MSSDVTFLFVMVLTILVLKESAATFEQQYLGDYLTDEEYENREKCESKLCILDGDEFFSAATQNSSIRPCDDFKEFAMGTFIKFRALNERYESIGFYRKSQDLYLERLRKLLNGRIIAKESKIFKVLKSYFQKCTNSNLILEFGATDITSYLMEFGGSPLLSNGSWNDEAFDIPTLFIREPHFATDLLLGRRLDRCNDPRNISKEILCFGGGWIYVPNETFISDSMQIFKHLRLDLAAIEKGLNSYAHFLSYQNDLRSTYSDDDEFKVIHIKDLTKAFPMIPMMDWLKIINSQLMSDSQVTEEDEILIRNFNRMEGFAKFMMSENESIIADVFSVKFLRDRRASFVVYPHFRFQKVLLGTQKGFQRFETCISLLRYNMNSALDALFAETYFDKDTQEFAETFAVDAVADVVNAIDEAEIENIEAKKSIIDKLKSVKYIIMSPDEILDRTKIAEMYDELDLDGSESVLEMELGMEKHFNKLETEKTGSWKKKLIGLTQDGSIEYFPDENILYVPMRYCLYPFFHKKRPRFFNMATVYTSMIYALKKGALQYLKKEFNINLRLTDFFTFADERYMTWQASVGHDLHLSSFKLTNRQMLWLAMAHVYTAKFQKGYKADPPMLLKRFKSFRQAFGCQELNAL